MERKIGRMVLQRLRTASSGSNQWGFDPSIFRNCAGCSLTVKPRSVEPGMAVRFRSVRKLESIRQDEDHVLNACNGVKAVVGSSPTLSSDGCVSERRGASLQNSLRGFKSRHSL